MGRVGADGSLLIESRPPQSSTYMYHYVLLISVSPSDVHFIYIEISALVFEYPLLIKIGMTHSAKFSLLIFLLPLKKEKKISNSVFRIIIIKTFYRRIIVKFKMYHEIIANSNNKTIFKLYRATHTFRICTAS